MPFNNWLKNNCKILQQSMENLKEKKKKNFKLGVPTTFFNPSERTMDPHLIYFSYFESSVSANN